MSESVLGLMVNYCVRDLDAMRAQVEEHGDGRFGGATDPEGNRLELWEPPR
jgi:hypothetical protein